MNNYIKSKFIICYNDDDDEIDPETGEVKVKHDYLNEMTISDAKEINKDYQIGDEILEEVTPKDFGRVAAGAAKQVVMQKIREAERENIMNEFSQMILLISVPSIRALNKPESVLWGGTKEINSFAFCCCGWQSSGIPKVSMS